MRNPRAPTRIAALALALSLVASCSESTTSESSQAEPESTPTAPDNGPAAPEGTLAEPETPTSPSADGSIPDWAVGSTIPSGVEGAADIQITKVVKNGSGPVCGLGKNAKVKYKAMLADGTVKDPGTQPYEFVVGTSPVIQAWHTIVSNMRVGDSLTVQIPEAVVASEGQRYANMGDWVFEMELLSVR